MRVSVFTLLLLIEVDDIKVDHGSSCMTGIDEAIELGSSGIQISNNKVFEDDDISEIKTSASSFSPVFPLECHRLVFHSIMSIVTAKSANETFSVKMDFICSSICSNTLVVVSLKSNMLLTSILNFLF